MILKDLTFEKVYDGVQAQAAFDNGYEISLVKHSGSYGGSNGLYELGVFGSNGQMCDPLGWGDDVKGWLTLEDAEKELQLIKAL
tara:strand:+ start:215 stop:466 length:252 start_codon:yes stop_codon:yes gene_type:complete